MPSTYPRISTTHDATDKRREAFVDAILTRAGVVAADGRPLRAATSNPYRGLRLVNIARECLEKGKVRDVASMNQMQVVGMAFTQGTSDFPVILENVMHKTLQAAYALQPDTWTRFCAKGSVSDFHPHPRYRVGGLSNLEAVTELGEFRNKSIPDGEKGTIQVGTKGNIINISREAVINDDLGAFTSIANALGRAAKRTIEADVYAALALNSGNGPLLADGNALFHASHGNLAASGSAISVTSVDQARQAMATQKDVGNTDFLAISPAVLLCPLTMGGKAREVNGAEYNDDTNRYQRKPNVVRGLFRDIVDTPRLTGTAWHCFADPEEAPAMEVAFLDGNSEPYLASEDGFSVDGVRWKVRLDYGVAAVDYRGAYRNPGA
jgi:hypothetical protein